ncbi:MAG TPA: hypothetical protein VGE96_00910 [Steroidobacteraceae bacterium]
MIPAGTLCEIICQNPTARARRLGAAPGRFCEVIRHAPAPRSAGTRGMVNIVRLPGSTKELWATDAALRPIVPPGNPDRADSSEPRTHAWTRQ